MIDKREIPEAATSFSLLPNVVEKDYVLGWILAGIDAHNELPESWVFKPVFEERPRLHPAIMWPSRSRILQSGQEVLLPEFGPSGSCWRALGLGFS